MEGALFYSARQCYVYRKTASAPTPNGAPARLKVRENIDSRAVQELAGFRRAVKRALALNKRVYCAPRPGLADPAAASGSHRRSAAPSRCWAPQRRQVGQAVEVGAGHGGPEGRIGERVHRVDRARLDRRDAAAVDPPAGSEPGQDGLPGRLDLACGQQGAEEQVSVVGQAPAQSTRVIDQGCGIGQLIHRLTVATAGICPVQPARQVWPRRPGVAAPAVSATAGLLLREGEGAPGLSCSGKANGTRPWGSRPRN
jgi:hypothetical protein